MRFILPFVGICTACLPSAIVAQEAAPSGVPHGQVAIGAGVAPEYDGSSDVRAIPFVLADIRWQGINFEFRGLRARADLVSDPRFAIGPVIGARLDRSGVDGPVGLLPEIDAAIEAGAFIGYRFGGDRLGQGSLLLDLTAVHDVSNTHKGLLATASASYAAVRKPNTFVTVDVQTTWANADYTRTYFGVPAGEAVRSGLDAYRPGSGIRDVGAGLSAGYYFDRHFGVIARAGATYLVGDIADSPVTELGSRWQPLGGVTLSYRF
ncbi:MipA/OmpV family protein [Sphingomonas xinjiangensis]|uniref:Outer membrane scaffolding protein for murein synthesis (MipA/OmpV family) n=1 Tax=Sphingomonas xinjiangensis TaxID=643568 RepID=A0A840YTF4_9SPHN|nr:MipA/OmpV family protein [Sphingomonas xinjiangensis]MBB5712948.1 outer membrane scaffolding protein for murein synthesis (MipA/OmpV family) [Sphingomonas xinjiangensis]